MDGETGGDFPGYRKPWKYYFSTLLLSLTSYAHVVTSLLCSVFIAGCLGLVLLVRLCRKWFDVAILGKSSGAESCSSSVLTCKTSSSSNPYTTFLVSHIPPFFLPAVPDGTPSWLGATTAASWVWEGKGLALGIGGETVRVVREGVEVDIEVRWRSGRGEDRMGGRGGAFDFSLNLT